MRVIVSYKDAGGVFREKKKDRRSQEDILSKRQCMQRPRGRSLTAQARVAGAEPTVGEEHRSHKASDTTGRT